MLTNEVRARRLSVAVAPPVPFHSAFFRRNRRTRARARRLRVDVRAKWPGSDDARFAAAPRSRGEAYRRRFRDLHVAQQTGSGRGRTGLRCTIG